MGLLQRCVETYDAMEQKVGFYEGEKEPLAPIGHIISKAQIEITIDGNGKYISAQGIDKRIIIPVTEESSGRTSAPVPHPLCDNINYLSGDDEEKYNMFINQMEAWCEAGQYTDVKVQAVYSYVKQKRILDDVSAAGLIKRDDQGNINSDKGVVCWRVIGIGENSGTVYEDISLMKKYTSYYLSKLAERKTSVCYVSGNRAAPAQQHLKGVITRYGNAKVVSANDDKNFTYRGRFLDDREAVSISYLSSQKAHNALKWLASQSNQGVTFGNRVFICWNPQGSEVQKVHVPFMKRELEKKLLPSDYKKELNMCLQGYMNKLPSSQNVIIASFEAATKGRLSVTYYNELKGSDFLERLRYWEETCCWFDVDRGTYSPSLFDIVMCTCGIQRGHEDNSEIEADNPIQALYMQRLVKCRVDKAYIPVDIVRQLINRANNLIVYNKENQRRLLFTACAVIKKYKNDYDKEDWEMALDPEKKDRSYQYGRLLAVLDQIEHQDLRKRGEDRETNALRMQSVFVKRPAYATSIILDQIKSSTFGRLSPASRFYYERLIGQIMEQISEFGDAEYSKSLSETYLLGYYLQKNSFYESNKNRQEDSENE